MRDKLPDLDPELFSADMHQIIQEVQLDPDRFTKDKWNGSKN